MLPLYRDPQHDFAFVRFDPAAVKVLEGRSPHLNSPLLAVVERSPLCLIGRSFPSAGAGRCREMPLGGALPHCGL